MIAGDVIAPAITPAIRATGFGRNFLAIVLAVASLKTQNIWIFAVCWAGVALVLCGAIALHTDFSKWMRLIGCAAVLIVCGFVVYSQYQDNVEKSEQIAAGILYPDNKQRPEIANKCKIDKDAIAVFAGSFVGWAKTDNFTMFKIFGHPLIGAQKVSSGGIRINPITLFDDRGQVVASFQNNRFVIEPHAKGRMPNKSTLTIKDYHGTEIFNIQFLNENTIYFTGLFYYASDAKPIVVTADELKVDGNSFRGGCAGGASTAIAIGG